MELLCLCLLLGFWLPIRLASYAFRAVTGIVCLGYGAYFVDAIHSHDGLPSASIGFVVIGVPCLMYTILGRFTLKKPPEESEDSDGIANEE